MRQLALYFMLQFLVAVSSVGAEYLTGSPTFTLWPGAVLTGAVFLYTERKR